MQMYYINMNSRQKHLDSLSSRGIHGLSKITQSHRSKTSARLHHWTTPSPNTISELYDPSTSTSVKVIRWQSTPEQCLWFTI